LYAGENKLGSTGAAPLALGIVADVNPSYCADPLSASVATISSLKRAITSQ
jgi:hypothetical protein